MTDPSIAAHFATLVALIDPTWRLLGVDIASGGAAAHVTVIAIGKPDGARERLVVRRHRPRDLAANPDIAALEFRLLALLAAEGIAASQPIHLDPGTAFATPCLVVSHIAGMPASEDDLEPGALVVAMADYLARLHRIDGNRADLAFMPRMDRWLADTLAQMPAMPDEALSESRIRAALVASPPMTARHRPALLHGDFWPGNVIWRDGSIAGAIDWEDAVVGDPVAELANARFELAWTIGPEFAARFTDRYVANVGGAIDLHDLPHWDLAAALRPAGWLGDWGYDPETERAMRLRHRDFVDRALAALAARTR